MRDALVNAGVGENIAAYIHLFLYSFLLLILVFVALIGQHLFENINWDKWVISLSVALIAATVADLRSAVSNYEKTTSKVTDGLLSAMSGQCGEISLLDTESYLDVGKSLFSNYKGDIAFFNVELKMLQNKPLFQALWVDGILSNNSIQKIVLIPSESTNVDSLVQKVSENTKAFADRLGNDSIKILTSVNMIPQNQSNNVGGVLLSRLDGKHLRKVDYAVFLIRHPLFAQKEDSYQGTFLFYSIPREGLDDSRRARFNELDSWATRIHEGDVHES
ncbi:MAG: hypothetical protein ABW080_18870 [Candidatus Thiodiazotropha sp.]